jgi:hypothetical protein
MASFFNLDPDVAFQKLQAGITGEVEPLKRLGILVSENTIKMFAFKNQIGDLTEKNGRLTGTLTEQEKVFARFGVIMESTSKAQGDLFRTLPALANRFREFKNTVKDLGVSLGELFLEDVADSFGKMTQSIRNNKEKIVGFVEDIKIKIEGWLKSQGGIAGIWDRLLKKFGEIKKFVATELMPVFRKLGNILTEAAANFGLIESKVTVPSLGLSPGEQRRFNIKAGKESERSFGKDISRLRGKEVTIFEAMLDQMKIQTLQTKEQAL